MVFKVLPLYCPYRRPMPCVFIFNCSPPANVDHNVLWNVLHAVAFVELCIASKKNYVNACLIYFTMTLLVRQDIQIAAEKEIVERMPHKSVERDIVKSAQTIVVEYVLVARFLLAQ